MWEGAAAVHKLRLIYLGISGMTNLTLLAYVLPRLVDWCFGYITRSVGVCCFTTRSRFDLRSFTVHDNFTLPNSMLSQLFD